VSGDGQGGLSGRLQPCARDSSADGLSTGNLGVPQQRVRPATDPQWLERNGYETTPIPWGDGKMVGACLGGKRYQAKFKERIADMVTRYGLGLDQIRRLPAHVSVLGSWS